MFQAPGCTTAEQTDVGTAFERAMTYAHSRLQVTCLNEDVSGSCKNVFKPW